MANNTVNGGTVVSFLTKFGKPDFMDLFPGNTKDLLGPLIERLAETLESKSNNLVGSVISPYLDKLVASKFPDLRQRKRR
jgi:hypothetical protein